MAVATDSIPAPSRIYEPYRDARGRFAKRPESAEPETATAFPDAGGVALSSTSAGVSRLTDVATAAVAPRLSVGLMRRPGASFTHTRTACGLLDDVARQATARGGDHAPA